MSDSASQRVSESTNQRVGGTVIAQPTLAQAVETFLRLGMLGKKPATESWHRKRLALLVAEIGGEQPVVAILDADLMEWYAGLSRRRTRWGGGSSHPQAEGGLSPYYLYSMVRCARALFKWLNEQGLIAADPAARLALPRLPRTGRKGIADADAAKILRVSGESQGRDGLAERDLALLCFLEATGARLGGLLDLRLAALNLDQPEPLRRRVTVLEKFSQERTVFLTPTALAAMLAWLAVRPDIDDDHVFLGRSNGGRWKALSGNGVYGIVRRYARLAGVKRNWSPHQWRHRFGRKLAERGMSLGVISQIMGHKSSAVTTGFYGAFSSEELQLAYDRYMPQAG